jgi:hypothetical protein
VETLVIDGSRRKLGFAIAGCVVFVFLGRFLLGIGQWWGWVVLAFFGLGGIALVAVTLLRGAPRLILDPQGFEFTAVLRRSRFAWSDVAEFYVTSISGAKMVGIEFSERYTAMPRARAFSRFITGGVEGGIADQFSKSPEELCALLEQWRQKYSQS